MAEEQFQEKTEAPSERRREELRRDGQFAYSREIPASMILGTVILGLYFSGSYLVELLREMLTRSLSNLEWDNPTPGVIYGLFSFITWDVAVYVLFFFTALFAIAIFAGVAQIGFNISWKPLTPDFLKINPVSGLGRIFSLNNLVESCKIIFKISVVLYIGYSVLYDDLSSILHFTVTQKEAYLAKLWEIVLILLFKLFLSFAVLAAIDYLWQRINFERRIKMTKQEVREEQRQAEGDPAIKARIRQIQQKMSRARMLQEVPQADLVIANPTHYAVVLRYEPGVMAAPELVAKGLDYLALRIIEIAQAAGVSVQRQPEIARGLYNGLDIGDAIPEEYYAIIAELLAAAYKAKGKQISVT